jgi:DNA-binding transcriptional LysR family regulator
MNLRGIDLNLMVIFEAVMAEKSIAGAARSVGMTPSALSHALSRLRRTFNDPLIERKPSGMVPTQRALDLIGPVRTALQQLRRGIVDQLAFEPATSQRTFKLCISDFLSCCLLPRLCARVREEAPLVTLVAEHLQNDGKDSYEPGDIQLRVDAHVSGPRYRTERIWRDAFVVAMRANHPMARTKPTLLRLLELPYLEVSSAIIDRRALDEVLDSKGLARRNKVTIPNLAGVIPVLAHSDLWTVLPQKWVALYAGTHEIATAPLPVSGVEYAVDMIWHRDDGRDLGHRWLRNRIKEEFAALYTPVRGQLRAINGADRLDVVPLRVASHSA